MSINRVPKGVSDGGQFAPGSRGESGVLLAAPTINLSPGDGDSFNELADGEVIEQLYVHHSEDGGYFANPTKTINFSTLITPAEADCSSDEELDAFFDRNERIISDFFEERYGAEMTGESWDSKDFEFNVPVAGTQPTHQELVNTVWNGSKIVQLHNESDHGTFGSENLGRLLLEKISASSTAKEPYRARGEAMRMSQRDIDFMVESRSGVREVSDGGALAIARELSADRHYPALHRLSTSGYADTEKLRNELREAYQDNADHQLTRQRIDMMFTWLMHGGDNS